MGERRNGKQETENRKKKTGRFGRFSISGFLFSVFYSFAGWFWKGVCGNPTPWYLATMALSQLYPRLVEQLRTQADLARALHLLQRDPEPHIPAGGGASRAR